MTADDPVLEAIGDAIYELLSEDPQVALYEDYADAIGAALHGLPHRVLLPWLGMCAVAMSDSDCGWIVSSSVEEAGAWSTVPDGGWTRDG